MTPLHCAASSGNIKIMQLLLQHGADLNATTFVYKFFLKENTQSKKHMNIKM